MTEQQQSGPQSSKRRGSAQSTVDDAFARQRAKMEEALDKKINKAIDETLEPPKWKRALPWGGGWAGGVVSVILFSLAANSCSKEPVDNTVAATAPAETPKDETAKAAAPTSAFNVYQMAALRMVDPAKGKQNFSAPVKYIQDLQPGSLKTTLENIGRYGFVPAVAATPLVIASNPEWNTNRIISIPERIAQNVQGRDLIEANFLKVTADIQDANVQAITDGITYRFEMVAQVDADGQKTGPDLFQIIRDVRGDNLKTEGDDNDMAVIYELELKP